MIYVFIGIVLLVLMGIYATEQKKDLEQELDKAIENKGLDLSSRIDVGEYVGGHPDIDQPAKGVFFLDDGDSLIIYSRDGDELTTSQRELGMIPKNQIKDVSIEDSSSIERRISAGRLLLVGIFAFAWKKKKLHEKAFTVIEWNDGKFNHTTIFMFDQKDAMQLANTVRNKLIRKLR